MDQYSHLSSYLFMFAFWYKLYEIFGSMLIIGMSDLWIGVILFLRTAYSSSLGGSLSIYSALNWFIVLRLGSIKEFCHSISCYSERQSPRAFLSTWSDEVFVDAILLSFAPSIISTPFNWNVGIMTSSWWHLYSSGPLLLGGSSFMWFI